MNHSKYLLRSIKNFQYKDYEQQKYHVSKNFAKIYPHLWYEISYDNREHILSSLNNIVLTNKNSAQLKQLIQLTISYYLTKETSNQVN